METLISLAGIAGAACCVGMYAAVSFGRISAEAPLFYVVNGFGALLIMLGAWQSFDMGDLGTIAQEMTWAVLSLIGALRASPKCRAAFERLSLRLRDIGPAPVSL
jgi:hypothetical protein